MKGTPFAMTRGMSKILTFLFIFVLGFQALAMPRQIILIRHGEEPKGKEGNHLSNKGWRRAQELVKFINRPELQKQGPPAALFAMKPKNKKGSVRPIETLTYLSSAYQLEIQSPFTSEEIDELVESIEKDRSFDGRQIVICWGHDDLKAIAKKFGAPAKKWDGDVYDRAWILNYSDSNLTSFQDVPQKLLPGDSED